VDVALTLGDKNSTGYLESILDRLFPAVSNLTAYPKGEVRVVVVSSLRRMVPAVCRFIESLSGQMKKDMVAKRASILRLIISKTTGLLSDLAPIPQYCLRLVMDCLGISIDLERAVVSELLTSGAAECLVQLLGGSLRGPARDPRDEHARASNDSTAEDAVDPQVGAILHAIIKSSGTLRVQAETLSHGSYLMQCGLASSVESSLKRELRLLGEQADLDSCDLSGLSSSVQLLRDSLEHCLVTSPSSRGDWCSPLEGSHSLMYSFLKLCVKTRLSSKDVIAVQSLSFLCLSLHVQLFHESAFKTLLAASSQLPKTDQGIPPAQLLEGILSESTVRQFIVLYFPD
jgi:hypothetical protein